MMITFQGLIVSLILTYTKREKCVEYNLVNYFLEVQDHSSVEEYKTGFLLSVYAFPRLPV